jgi:hypothetical protein
VDPCPAYDRAKPKKFRPYKKHFNNGIKQYIANAKPFIPGSWVEELAKPLNVKYEEKDGNITRLRGARLFEVRYLLLERLLVGLELSPADAEAATETFYLAEKPKKHHHRIWRGPGSDIYEVLTHKL